MSQTWSEQQILDKVTALILKAESTHSSEEARTCAVTAIQLIRKYDLRVVRHGRTEPPRPAPPPAQKPPPPKPAQKPKPAPSARRWSSSGKATPRWIRSKYEGHCMRCFIPYDPGDRVLWTKGEGCLCDHCA